MLVTLASGPARHVRLTVHGDGIIHVVAATGTDLPGETSLMVPAAPTAGDYTVTAGAGHVFLPDARGGITRFGNPRPYRVASR